MFRICKKSGSWSLEFYFILLICAFLYGSGDTKPLYYLIEYNRLDLLIAVKNKNINEDDPI